MSRDLGSDVRVVALLAEPRVYVKCINTDHNDCFRYRTLRQFTDELHARRYMVAWRMMGNHINRYNHIHNCDPTDDDLTSAQATQQIHMGAFIAALVTRINQNKSNVSQKGKN